MTPSPLADALVRSRDAWLTGDRAAWSRYAVCVVQLRAIDVARFAAPPPPRPHPPRGQA